MTTESTGGDAPDPQAVAQQTAGKLLTNVAGYVATRTIEMGLEHGVFEALHAQPDGLTVEELAKAAGLDAYYTGVWLQSALAAEFVDIDEAGKHRLAPAVGALLLERDGPGYLGGIFRIMGLPELFDRFSERFASGQRTWWDETSERFIGEVAMTSRPFYTRLLGAGIPQVPGLAERLEGGGRVLELASGIGAGLVRIAQAYPDATFVGVDGDAVSLAMTRKTLDEAGVGDRVELVESTLEDYTADGEFDVVLINVSMHECRDIEQVTKNVLGALKPGGIFVISDFPFPADTAGLRTIPARVMTGIQFFEAQIDDQLLPTQAYIDLLGRHGFADVAAFDLAPVHAVTHGARPQ